jgi:hypothetical protein
VITPVAPRAALAAPTVAEAVTCAVLHRIAAAAVVVVPREVALRIVVQAAVVVVPREVALRIVVQAAAVVVPREVALRIVVQAAAVVVPREVALRIVVQAAAVVVPREVVRRIVVQAAAVVVPREVARRIVVLTAVVFVPGAMAWWIAELAAAAAVQHAVAQRNADEPRIAVALQIVVVLWAIARRDARRVLQSGTPPGDVAGRLARARGPMGHDPRVLFVAMTTTLFEAAHRRLSEEASSGVEAKTPVADVGPLGAGMERSVTDVGLWGTAKEESGTQGRPLGTDRLHPEVGVGSRRLNWPMIPNARNLMSRLRATLSSHPVMLTDVASAARKGSGFRRRFRELALRLVARLRNGFAPAASLSTVNWQFSVYASGRPIMYGSTVA